MKKYHAASIEVPLLSEMENTLKTPAPKIASLPPSLARVTPLCLPNLDETQVVRHFHRLSQMNYGIDSGMYPLGSCTMKYNPKICEHIASWSCFAQTSPLQDISTVQGNLQVIYELEKWLCEITGMDAMTLQPAAGAQGEFTGALIARAYLKSIGEEQRDEIILPDTAHGTNPASATMSGFRLVEIPSTQEGTVDLEVLKKMVSEKTALFMLTNPNTLGIFESDIKEIAEIVHDAGGLLYYDGANMNAIMGKTRPGDMGFDIVHLNLHKTFATPHGGGGPGSGPVGVTRSLEKFLPVPRVVRSKQNYQLSYAFPESIGKIRSWYGNFSAILKAYVYVRLLGPQGLKEAAEIAVLNANYMKERILKNGCFDVPYKSLRKHEFVISAESLLKQKGVRAADVAKRLLDYGLHAPTVYFPLIVKEALMIEPTETEDRSSLDAYVEALCSIANEEVETLKAAPLVTPVGRIDEAEAVKRQVFTWNDL